MDAVNFIIHYSSLHWLSSLELKLLVPLQDTHRILRHTFRTLSLLYSSLVGYPLTTSIFPLPHVPHPLILKMTVSPFILYIYIKQSGAQVSIKNHIIRKISNCIE